MLAATAYPELYLKNGDTRRPGTEGAICVVDVSTDVETDPIMFHPSVTGIVRVSRGVPAIPCA
jgi:hypothetical protein